MNRGPLVSIGSQGPDVRRLQRVLVEMKLLDFPIVSEIAQCGEDLAHFL